MSLNFMKFQYNLQTDMSRRQLEYEAKKLRDKLAETLGSADQITQRQEARLARIRMVENEMLHIQQHQVCNLYYQY